MRRLSEKKARSPLSILPYVIVNPLGDFAADASTQPAERAISRQIFGTLKIMPPVLIVGVLFNAGVTSAPP